MPTYETPDNSDETIGAYVLNFTTPELDELHGGPMQVVVPRSGVNAWDPDDHVFVDAFIAVVTAAEGWEFVSGSRDWTTTQQINT